MYLLIARYLVRFARQADKVAALHASLDESNERHRISARQAEAELIQAKALLDQARIHILSLQEEVAKLKSLVPAANTVSM